MATRVIGAAIKREDPGISGQAWFVRPVPLRCTPTGMSHSRITAWCTRSDGRDISCEAIRAGIAERWDKFDRARRLASCEKRSAIADRLFGLWTRRSSRLP